MRNISRRITFPAVALLVGTSVALAHSGASGIVKERMEAMKSISAAMKAMASMIRGKTEFHPAAAIEATEVIERHASHIPELFPEGSDHKPSEALPAIWGDWEQFTALAIKMQEEAAALSQRAADASQPKDIAPQFAELGQTCSTCHEQFRQSN